MTSWSSGLQRAMPWPTKPTPLVSRASARVSRSSSRSDISTGQLSTVAMIIHLFLVVPDASRLVALLTFSDRRDRAFTLTGFRAAGRWPDQDRSCSIIAIGQLLEVTVQIGTLVLIVWLIIG